MPRRSSSSRTGSPTGSRTGGSPGSGNPPTPRNRTPQPLPRRRRSFGDLVKAFLAFVALVGAARRGALRARRVRRLAVPGRIAFPGLAAGRDHGQHVHRRPRCHRVDRLGPVHRVRARRGEGRAVRRRECRGGCPGPGRVSCSRGNSSPRCCWSEPRPPPSHLASRSSGTATTTTSGAPSPPPRPTPGGMFAQQQEQAASTAAALGQQAADAASHAEVGGPSVKAGTRSTTGFSPPRGVTTTPCGR